jgi:hypothetical protein
MVAAKSALLVISQRYGQQSNNIYKLDLRYVQYGTVGEQIVELPT